LPLFGARSRTEQAVAIEALGLPRRISGLPVGLPAVRDTRAEINPIQMNGAHSDRKCAFG